tara:strand:- start:173 stop:319 length:147 start_codon:yes stop_codon:yes gene_type:complete
MKGLEIANETCITINDGGILAIQHQCVEPGGGEPNYIDFVLASLEVSE